MPDDNQTTDNTPKMAQPFGVSTPAGAPDPAPLSEPTTAPVTTNPATVFTPLNSPAITTTHEPLDSQKPDKPAQDKDLENIKEKALKELTPLLDNLDQTPEEKYKTLMMVIQASDNKDLVAKAYEAAQKITDAKVRADALVGILNEINYFTQPSK